MNLTWQVAIEQYIGIHCAARGLRALSQAAYLATLRQFSEWIPIRRADAPPSAVYARDVLEYVQHLRADRGNGDAAVNR